MLRVVAIEGVLVPDHRKRLPGRGAYLHFDLSCFELAERRKALPRALRVAGPLDGGPVREVIEAAGQALHNVTVPDRSARERSTGHPPLDHNGAPRALPHQEQSAIGP
jgi:predicted RNA-binding protein YlxR (DUF448 family)